MVILLQDWVIKEFDYAEQEVQLIEFDLNGVAYVMTFNKVSAFRDDECIQDKVLDYGIEYRENSFDVKFDLLDNFENDTFYQKPPKQVGVVGMRKLGKTISDILSFHHKETGAEIYYSVAESEGLKAFYDRLVKKYANELHFEVENNIGDRGLGYEIKTPSYRRETGEDQGYEANQSRLHSSQESRAH